MKIYPADNPLLTGDPGPSLKIEDWVKLQNENI